MMKCLLCCLYVDYNVSKTPSYYQRHTDALQSNDHKLNLSTNMLATMGIRRAFLSQEADHKQWYYVSSA